ncbi:MAG: hypothetical protein GWN58_61525, partial [Anaerolineae bacterium]|nr:hypothetical protein [Anaerolineae bacterium]
MPRGDGTGPRGAGPRTGRGMGTCNGSQTPGFASSRPGRGLGLGAGLRSMRRWFAAFPRGTRLGGRGAG